MSVKVPAGLELLQVIQARDGISAGLGPAQRWQKQTRQNCDNGDYNQQLDKGEGRAPGARPLAMPRKQTENTSVSFHVFFINLVSSECILANGACPPDRQGLSPLPYKYGKSLSFAIANAR